METTRPTATLAGRHRSRSLLARALSGTGRGLIRARIVIIGTVTTLGTKLNTIATRLTWPARPIDRRPQAPSHDIGAGGVEAAGEAFGVVGTDRLAGRSIVSPQAQRG